MNKCVELPLIEPMYKTYHDGIVTASLVTNPSIRNWFLSNTVVLTCNRKFLTGFTTPVIRVENYALNNTLFQTIWVPMKIIKGGMNNVIRNLINEGFYINFNGVDDYYVEGKSWYKEKHFSHDGTICGYDRLNKSYCIYAYDSNWIYRKFWTSQTSFNKGCNALFQKGEYGCLCAFKPRLDKVEFSIETVFKCMVDYLDSNLQKYPEDGEGNVRGIIVHEYIAKYIDKLYDGSIPYERMDRRVFRLIWEHKKIMFERIEKIEEVLNISNEISLKYKPLVAEANTMRMLYASHHMKRRDSVLPIIKKKLLTLMEREKELLTLLVQKMGDENGDKVVELSKKQDAI